MLRIAHLPWTHPLEGLPLAVPTHPEWARVARDGLDALLVDHAHCEQKAASSAMAMIGRFSEHPGLARAMVALAQEEMRHFRQVLDVIEGRGRVLTPPRPDLYVRALREWGFRHHGGIGPRGDLLLISAFVEARSCERFRLLAEAFLEPGTDGPPRKDEPTFADAEAAKLGGFYLRLAEAESRHWELFRDLAREGEALPAVERRLAEMARAEGEIVASRPLEPRMH